MVQLILLINGATTLSITTLSIMAYLRHKASVSLAIMLIVVKLRVVMLNVVMPNVVMMSVVMLNVVTLNVVAPIYLSLSLDWICYIKLFHRTH